MIPTIFKKMNINGKNLPKPLDLVIVFERRQTGERAAKQSEVYSTTHNLLLEAKHWKKHLAQHPNTPLGSMKNALRFHFILFPSQEGKYELIQESGATNPFRFINF